MCVREKERQFLVSWSTASPHWGTKVAICFFLAILALWQCHMSQKAYYLLTVPQCVLSGG